MNLEKERKLASEIIDRVEWAIRKAHPKVDKVGKNCQGNTLLYGEKYFDLEDTLTELLQDAYNKKKQDIFNPSKRD
jgi:hypothetical protein